VFSSTTPFAPVAPAASNGAMVGAGSCDEYGISKVSKFPGGPNDSDLVIVNFSVMSPVDFQTNKNATNRKNCRLWRRAFNKMVPTTNSDNQTVG